MESTLYKHGITAGTLKEHDVDVVFREIGIRCHNSPVSRTLSTPQQDFSPLFPHVHQASLSLARVYAYIKLAEYTKPGGLEFWLCISRTRARTINPMCPGTLRSIGCASGSLPGGIRCWYAFGYKWLALWMLSLLIKKGLHIESTCRRPSVGSLKTGSEGHAIGNTERTAGIARSSGSSESCTGLESCV